MLVACVIVFVKKARFTVVAPLVLFEKQSLEGASGTPEALAAIVRAEVAKRPTVVKAAAIAAVERWVNSTGV